MAYEIEDAAADLYWIHKWWLKGAPLDVLAAHQKLKDYLDLLCYGKQGEENDDA